MAGSANVKPKKLDITLGGVERKIKLDMNAFASIEDHYPTIDAAMTALEAGSIKAMRVLLWAGLLHEDSKLTIQDIGGLVTMAEMPRVSEVIANALTMHLPDAEEMAEAAESPVPNVQKVVIKK